MSVIVPDIFGDEMTPTIVEESDESDLAVTCTQSRADQCSECGHGLDYTHEGIVCFNCSTIDESQLYELDVSHEGGTDNYNTTPGSTLIAKIVGPAGSQQYSRDMLRSVSRGSGPMVRLRLATDTIRNKVNAQPTSHGIPDHVIQKAADFFNQVLTHMVLRGRPRLATMGACLQRECQLDDFQHHPKEFAAIMGVDVSELSAGDKTLEVLHRNGLIKHASFQGQGEVGSTQTSKEDKALKDLRLCLTLLKIAPLCEKAGENSQCIIKFCEQLIKFTIVYGISADSQPNTRAVGAIRFVALRRPDLGLQSLPLDTVCKISKSTFARFVKNVDSVLLDTAGTERSASLRRKLLHLCRRHRIIARPPKVDPNDDGLPDIPDF
jgi:hypothetical protein